MCVIIIGKIGEAYFKAAKTQNPDGFSFFTKELGLVKAPNDELVKQAVKQFGIWHFRIGTSGTKDVNNVHPFPICNGTWLLYHNGILGKGLGDLSDTHALANTLQNVTPETAMTVLESVSSGQRLLMVDASNPHNFRMYGSWDADAGLIMSHKIYEPASFNDFYSQKYEKKKKIDTSSKITKPTDWLNKKSDLLYDEPFRIAELADENIPDTETISKKEKDWKDMDAFDREAIRRNASKKN